MSLSLRICAIFRNSRPLLKTQTATLHNFPRGLAKNSCFFCTSLRQPSIVSSSNKLHCNTFSTKVGDGKDEKIYQGGLVPHVRRIKYFTLSTSVLGVAVQPVIWTKFLAKVGAGMAYSMLTFVSFFTIVTPLLIHYVTKKYVAEMYYNPDTQTYTAITFSFFNGRVETKFKQEDVFMPDMLGIFESFRVNNKPLLVDSSQFREPKDYGKLMGFDKPIDFTYYEDKEKQK
ncbi:transmembrane protein 70 homolog, mitochondrial [Cloeon dipterum]|uniref:transmembrane protein 70 homolog, mitochondrial n=1 Tax=Cloeon dipterum TaxID=197152 RepID=UPI00321F9F03